jgi:hypothetical protein
MRLASGALVAWIGCMLAPAAAAQFGVTAGAGAVAPPCVDSEQTGYVAPSTSANASCTGSDGIGNASGETDADLRTGIFAVSAAADSTQAVGATANSVVRFNDRLTFQVPQGLLAPEEPLTVHVSFTLDGTVSGDAAPPLSTGHFLEYHFDFTDLTESSDTHSFSVDDVISAPTTGVVPYAKDVLLRSPFFWAEIVADQVEAACTEGSVDYVATVAIDVPPGVTWTSETGAFLAPEPAAGIAALAVGLALAALRTRAGC